MVTRIVPKTHLRDRIRQELADLGSDTVLITDRGRPAAVVVAVERWNELQEMVEELEDAAAVLEWRTARSEAEPAEHVFATIEAEEVDVPS